MTRADLADWDVGYTVADGSAADCSDQWESATRAAYVPLAVKVDGGTRHRSGQEATERIQRVDLDDIALVDIHCNPCSVARSRSTISTDDNDYIAVLVNRHGVERVTRGETATVLPAGAVAFWDTRETARFDVMTSIFKRTLLIPRSAVRDATGPRFVLPVEPLQGPKAGLLGGFLDLLAEHAGSLTAAERIAARNSALELLGGLASPSRESVGASGALRPQIERWLGQNLDRPLSPEYVASANAVSVRSLHRLFHATGETLGDVIRRQRLLRAREDLVRTTETVSAIAHRWQFADASHFSRAFRREFGSSPVDYRRTREPSRP